MMKEYFKNYYQNNKAKWKEYNSSEYYKEYHANYYKSNKEIYAQRHNEFIKKYEGKFVYFILDEKNEIKYIGKSTNLYKRFFLHKYRGDKFDADTDYIIYLDFTDKLTEEELEDAEKYFIELYKLELNKCRGDYDTSILLKITNKDLVFREFKI